MTHCVVIDTNVFAVAAGLHDGASEECMLACVQVLRLVEAGQRLAVDAGDEILSEYMKTLRACSGPNLASKLAIKLFRRRFNHEICHLVGITPARSPRGSFSEVPARLQDFDVDDQKFIAVAAAEGATPPVFAALDGEWWDRRVDFVAAGIDVQFRCAADLV